MKLTQTERSRAVRKAYRQSENGKARRRAAQAKYQKSAKGKLSAKKFWAKYIEPEHLRKARRLRGNKYNKTPRGRAIRAHHAATRRALKKGASVSDLTLISNWLKRWKSSTLVRCYWCRSVVPPKKCHTDHIIPLAKGGVHSIENMCISCEFCNRTKQAKNIGDWNKELREPVML